jgi:hypothetical protein
MSDELAVASRMARSAGDSWGWGYIDPFKRRGKPICNHTPHAKAKRAKRKAERQAKKKNRNRA